VTFKRSGDLPPSTKLDTTMMTGTLIVNPLGGILESVGVDVNATVKNQLLKGLAAFV